MANLVQQYQGTTLPILKDIRRNLRKTQAGLKLIITMEKELKNTAKDADNAFKNHLEIETKMLKDDKKPPPFSSWAG